MSQPMQELDVFYSGTNQAIKSLLGRYWSDDNNISQWIVVKAVLEGAQAVLNDAELADLVDLAQANIDDLTDNVMCDECRKVFKAHEIIKPKEAHFFSRPVCPHCQCNRLIEEDM